MGGEKPAVAAHVRAQLGSPPHGRGKAAIERVWKQWLGITPAWAGKRETPFYRKSISKDHPRMGGEKANGNDAPDDDEGSPPHGQGKDDVFRGQILLPGITPAWAGKRTSSEKPVSTHRDHPRVGGEKLARLYSSVPVPGSPPRERGKGKARNAVTHQLRITPAWAGKSPASQPWSPPLWMMVIRPRP